MMKLWTLILSLLFPPAAIIPTLHTQTPTMRPQTEITMIVTGDVLPARTINARSVEIKNFTWPWQSTKTLLKQADIVFINLETPLVDKCPISRSGTTFCGDVRSVEGLIESGVDVVNLANNHINNFGQTGIDSTELVLKSNNISSTGIKNPAIMIVKGKRFAFLGFNAVPLSISIDQIAKQISLARKEADFVIVQFHWGNEYTTKISDQQRQLAYLSIDSGADLVLGNHPHWVQPEEIYKGKIIKYAFGNFIFDQFWSAETLKGEVGKFVFSDTQIISHSYIPIQIDQYGQPHLTNTK
jgi:gamma-polyglutamate biosynthesis protein CapA